MENETERMRTEETRRMCGIESVKAVYSGNGGKKGTPKPKTDCTKQTAVSRFPPVSDFYKYHTRTTNRLTRPARPASDPGASPVRTNGIFTINKLSLLKAQRPSPENCKAIKQSCPAYPHQHLPAPQSSGSAQAGVHPHKSPQAHQP